MSRLWYRQPAKEWEEALPLGNGRMGAMVFGGVEQERIQVNEESVWYGGETDRINPDAHRYLEEIRRRIFAGEIAGAQELLQMAVAGCPNSMRPYQTLGDIRLEFPGTAKYEQYERSLYLEDALCRTSFVSGGTGYLREAFLSHPDDCMVMKLSAHGPGKINLRARLERGRFYDGVGRLGEKGIYLHGNLGSGGFFAFGLLAQAKGGSVQVIGETLCVREAEQLTLYFCGETTGKYQEPGKPDPVNILREEIAGKLEAAAECAYEQLLERHREDYRRYYARVDFWLEGCREHDGLPTDQRLKSISEEPEDLGLHKLLFDYGRYLMISCSRPGGLPATLQGIWNQSFFPPWDSKYTININLEMNYWIAECCNLSECHMPLFELIRKMRVSGRRAAERMYGCRGFAAHHNTDVHGDCAPQDLWYAGTYWVMGAAWLCTHIWNHYEYTQDRDFLKEYYPVLCEAALFFLDYLTEKDGRLVTCPSCSPENSYRLPGGESGAVTYGAAMDNQILRDLFGQCLLAAKVLGESGAVEEAGIADERAFLAQVRDAMDRLAPICVSGRGTIQEWIEDYEECEPGHRHISQLYALHPSGQITVDGTPRLAEAARRTLERRLEHGGGHTGWSRAWIINHYAKLWDGEEACRNLQLLLTDSVYPNLFDRHPPFQIDGNFGAAAAMAQMLIQSSSERIVVLPALPSAWASGCVRGLRIRGNCEVELSWENHELRVCRLTAFSHMHTRALYRGKAVEIRIPAGHSADIAGLF